jgi:hypothetical protein
MLGFGLGIAILFDAFVVRMAIVPAVLALIGKSAWWLPSWLNSLLPNVDMEGENLRRQLTTSDREEGGRRSSRQPRVTQAVVLRRAPGFSPGARLALRGAFDRRSGFDARGSSRTQAHAVAV